MSKKIEPTEAMVDEAANILSLNATGTSLRFHDDPVKLAYRYRVIPALRAALNHPDAAGLFAAEELPTEDGSVIVPAEGHEYIEASALHVTAAQYCREAVYEDPYYYGVWWRDGKAVHNGWRAENITPGTWKVADE